jgi:hypothetical protein
VGVDSGARSDTAASGGMGRAGGVCMYSRLAYLLPLRRWINTVGRREARRIGLRDVAAWFVMQGVECE